MERPIVTHHGTDAARESQNRNTALVTGVPVYCRVSWPTTPGPSSRDQRSNLCAGWMRGALSSSSARHPRYVSGVAILGAYPSPLALPGHVVDDWRLGE